MVCNLCWQKRAAAGREGKVEGRTYLQETCGQGHSIEQW